MLFEKWLRKVCFTKSCAVSIHRYIVTLAVPGDFGYAHMGSSSQFECPEFYYI